jgi:glutamine synthetase
MDKRELIDRCRDQDVKFLRLQFTELYGQLKNVSIPIEEIDKALDNELMFDGSSIRGFKRIEQSDMYFVPDPETFAIIPWQGRPSGQVARLICDVADPDGTPFVGDPRVQLKRVLAEAREQGYEMQVGPEAEFFLFKRTPDGEITIDPHDDAVYFDVGPHDQGEDARRDIEDVLHEMGFDLEASHHEVGIGQHEIDFRHADALKTADNLITFRWVVKVVAARNNMHATFMPKPIQGENGSGMHVNQSLSRGETNAFFDPDDELQLSDVAYGYIAGVMDHVAGITAVANPTINSYKRLIPGYEAPVYIAWSPGNRSAAIRVPAKRGRSTRAELRTPDPTANPYLAFAAMLAAGLDGVKRGLRPPAPVNRNIYHLTDEEAAEAGVKGLPTSLEAALDALEADDVLRKALGDHIFDAFVSEKRGEVASYREQVHGWEIEQYLDRY